MNVSIANNDIATKTYKIILYAPKTTLHLSQEATIAQQPQIVYPLPSLCDTLFLLTVPMHVQSHVLAP